MRPGVSRGLAGATLAAITLLAASACTSVDLTNEWPAMAAPTGWEPEVGTCHQSFAETSYRNAYDPIDCADGHRYETVHVGTFSGDAADLDAPPEKGSTALGAAWAECDKKTTEYLGGEWRDGLIWIAVSVPSKGNWEGGARWYRCEAAVTTYEIGDVNAFNKSIKGVAAELRRGCYHQDPKGDYSSMKPVPCDQSHNTEFVGSFVANGAWKSLQQDEDSIHRKCRSLIAKYVGVPDDGRMKYRSGTTWLYPSESDWESGDRSVRCHVWLVEKNVTRSLKGAGTNGLPIRYG